MKDIPHVDVDYCQFADWGYQKPTRVWGGDHIKGLKDWVCEPTKCPNVVQRPNGRLGHKEVFGGSSRIIRWETYRVPSGLIRYLES